MTPMRWVVLITALLLLCFLFFNMWYRSIHATVWAEEREITQAAAEAAQLVEIDHVDKHVWNATTWVVQGRDSEDNPLLVWMTDDAVEVTNAADGVTQETLRAQLAADNPDMDIIRIMPGRLDGQKAWEVYYRIDGSPTRYFYRFYRFDNGQLITTYNLPNRFAGSIHEDSE